MRLLVGWEVIAVAVILVVLLISLARLFVVARPTSTEIAGATTEAWR
jgi:hypothetical protein